MATTINYFIVQQLEQKEDGEAEKRNARAWRIVVASRADKIELNKKMQMILVQIVAKRHRAVYPPYVFWHFC